MPAVTYISDPPDSSATDGHQPQRIELDEWEQKDFRISHSVLSDLAKCQKKVLRVQILPSGLTRVKAGPFVGRIRLGTCDVVLRPKRPVPSLMILLAEVYELTHLIPELAAYSTSPEIVDLLVHIFIREVDKLVRRGLKRTYVNCEEDLVAIRGRVDVRKTFALHMRARPLARCSYEEFTVDGLENRTLLAALSAIASNASIVQARRRAAHKLTGDFTGVQKTSVLAGNSEKIACDRLSAHYEPVLRLAQIILASMGLANNFGGVDASGFLLNMNTLFEQFVYRRLDRTLSKDGISVRGQLTFAFDRAEQAEIRPDLVIQSREGMRIVADTKYKDKPGAHPNDLYQMLAYCRILCVKHGVLITLGDHATRRFEVCDGETKIEVVPVNLDGSLLDVERSIVRLTHHFRDRMTAPVGSASDQSKQP